MATLFFVLVDYAFFAIVEWNMYPGDWEEKTRLLFAVGGIFSIGVGGYLDLTIVAAWLAPKDESVGQEKLRWSGEHQEAKH